MRGQIESTKEFGLVCIKCFHRFSIECRTKKRFAEILQKNGWRRVRGHWYCKRCIQPIVTNEKEINDE